MISQSIQDLAKDLTKRRVAGDAPPILLLGAGASVAAGVALVKHLLPAFDCSTPEQFFQRIEPLSARERFRQLLEYLKTDDPFRLTSGYEALGALVSSLYFDLILTTNFDPLLEDALVAAKLRRKDYLLLINGIIQPRRAAPLLIDREPRVKVLKLHGDLFHREMAWTPAEMEQYQTQIAPHLKPVLRGRDLLIVGHSLADSPRVQKLTLDVLKSGGVIWYVNVAPVPDYLTKNNKVRSLVGTAFTFEEFFPKLARHLNVLSPAQEVAAVERAKKARPSAKGRAVQNHDEFLESVVGIALGNEAGGTGFVLSDPRLIVTDTFAMGGEQVRERAKVTIITFDHRRLEARVVGRVSSHPFGPWAIEVPDTVHTAGLRLNTEAPTKNLAIHIAVAAGERIGVSSGTLQDPTEKKLLFFFGDASQLVELACVTASGSAGAPVVDSSFAVRGFIVAGDHQTRSYMYPAYRWAKQLRAIDARSRSRSKN